MAGNTLVTNKTNDRGSNNIVRFRDRYNIDPRCIIHGAQQTSIRFSSEREGRVLVRARAI